MANLSKVIYINEEDYSTLINGGTITKSGQTYSYDESALYIIKDVSVPEYAETAGYAARAGTALTAVTDTSGNNIATTYSKRYVYKINSNDVIVTLGGSNVSYNTLKEQVEDPRTEVVIMGGEGKTYELHATDHGDTLACLYFNCVEDNRSYYLTIDNADGKAAVSNSNYTEFAKDVHHHGNITNSGDITATAPTIANGDQLVINDDSASKITNGPTFDGTTTNKALTPKGTWEGFLPSTGGELTGDLIFRAAAGLNSPSLIFQRGTLSDNYNDWLIQDRGGYLYFDQRGNGATAWSNQVYFDTAGNIHGYIDWSLIKNKPVIPSTTTANKILLSTTTSGTTIWSNWSTAGFLKTNTSGVVSVDSTVYAPLASPALTGTPTAPTATSGTNTTQIATTEFVQNAISNANSIYDVTINVAGFENIAVGTVLSGITTAQLEADLNANKQVWIEIHYGTLTLYTELYYLSSPSVDSNEAYAGLYSFTNVFYNTVQMLELEDDNGSLKVTDKKYVELLDTSNTALTKNGLITATKFVTKNGTSSLFVKGNGSLDSTAYAPLASPNLTGTPTAPTANSGTNTTQIATTEFVQNAVNALPTPMLFKGSLGTGGTYTGSSLPPAANTNKGWTVKVITDGTYQGVAAKVGDTLISDGTNWILIPSGDEPSGTVTSIKILAESPISIDAEDAITSNGVRTITHDNSGITAGTYTSVTVDAKGHVTAGSNPTVPQKKIINISSITNNKATFSGITSAEVLNIFDKNDINLHDIVIRYLNIDYTFAGGNGQPWYFFSISDNLLHVLEFEWEGENNPPACYHIITPISGIYYGTSGTARNMVAKTASIPGYSLLPGNIITIYFQYGFRVANATLNINNTGAKNVKVNTAGTNENSFGGFGPVTITFLYTSSLNYEVISFIKKDPLQVDYRSFTVANDDTISVYNYTNEDFIVDIVLLAKLIILIGDPEFSYYYLLYTSSDDTGDGTIYLYYASINKETLRLLKIKAEYVDALEDWVLTKESLSTFPLNISDELDPGGNGELADSAAIAAYVNSRGFEANVQSDWDESDSSDDAYIRNKPSFKTINSNTILGSGDIAIPTKLSSSYAAPAQASAPAANDTFETAVGKLHKAILEDEEITAIALNDLNNRMLTEESDPIFIGSPAYTISSSDIINWNNKISDSRLDSNTFNTGSTIHLLNDAEQTIIGIVTPADPHGDVAHEDHSKLIPTLDYLDTALSAKANKSTTTTAGTYKSVTVNSDGIVTAGTNPTTLAGYGITDAVQKITSTDNAIAKFDGTNGAIQNSGVTINNSNHITAVKHITSGGTSSQFVKGDGSLDSNSYATRDNAVCGGDYVTNPSSANTGTTKKDIFINHINDRLYAANSRFYVTHKVFDSSDDSFVKDLSINVFSGNIEQHGNTISEGQYAELYIGTEPEATLGTNSSMLWTYGSEVLYLTFYSARYPDSIDEAKLYHKYSPAGWDSCTITKISNAVYKIVLPNKTYPAAIKIKWSGSSSRLVSLSDVKAFGGRSTLNTEGVVTKYGIKQDLWGDVEAPKFIKRGGTSSQFLKADGSVDSNTYLTSSSLSDYVKHSNEQVSSDSSSCSYLAESIDSYNIYTTGPYQKTVANGEKIVVDSLDTATIYLIDATDYSDKKVIALDASGDISWTNRTGSPVVVQFGSSVQNTNISVVKYNVGYDEEVEYLEDMAGVEVFEFDDSNITWNDTSVSGYDTVKIANYDQGELFLSILEAVKKGKSVLLKYNDLHFNLIQADETMLAFSLSALAFSNFQNKTISFAPGGEIILETSQISSEDLKSSIDKANSAVLDVTITQSSSTNAGTTIQVDNGTTYTIVSDTEPQGSDRAYKAPSWGAMENKMDENELVVSAALNDLNTRINDLNDEKQDTLVSGTDIKTINNQSILGSGNIDITSDLGDSLVAMFSKLDGITPVRTIEYDIASTTGQIIFSRANVTEDALLNTVTDTLIYSIEVTGNSDANIYAQYKVYAHFQPCPTRSPMTFIEHIHKNPAGTASLEGLKLLTYYYPKAINNGYPYICYITAPAAGSRHIKIRVYLDSSNVSWKNPAIPVAVTEGLYNTTYLTKGSEMTITASGWITNGITQAATTTATVSTSLPKNFTANIFLAGEALTGGNLVYRALNDGKIYRVGTLTATINDVSTNLTLDPMFGVTRIINSRAINANIAASDLDYKRSINPSTPNNGSSFQIETGWVKGDTMYYKCTLSGSSLIPTGHITSTLSPGYAYFPIGVINTASSMDFDCIGHEFVTLNASGKVTHVNGLEIAGGSGGGGSQDLSDYVKYSNTTSSTDPNGSCSSSETVEDNAIYTSGSTHYIINPGYTISLDVLSDAYTTYIINNTSPKAILASGTGDIEWTNTTSSSVDVLVGSGNSGLNYTATIYLKGYTEEVGEIKEKLESISLFEIVTVYGTYYGDANEDNYVNSSDVARISLNLGSTDPKYDANNDGTTTIDDATYAVNIALGKDLPYINVFTNPYTDLYNIYLNGKIPVLKIVIGQNNFYVVMNHGILGSGASHFSGRFFAYIKTGYYYIECGSSYFSITPIKNATYEEVLAKQDTLVSGTNIKTINGESILGSGNITIQGGSGGGGDTNIIETIKVNGTALTPDSNKAVNITSIPSSIVIQDATHRFVSDTEKSTWNGKYSIPAGGIPISDLAVDPITSVTMNGNVVLASAGGAINLGTVITSHLSIKTINNNVITGTGNVTIPTGDTNVIETIKVNNTALTPTSKAINITVPTKLEDLEGSSDSIHVTQSAFSAKADKATTLSGYGITDAKIANGVITLGSNTITPLTSHLSIKTINNNTITGTGNITIATPGTLKTDNTTAQTTANNESLSGIVNLHKISKTGNYNDLIDKPTIPAAVTESTVSGWGFTKNAGTITGITMNGTSKGTSGVINLGTVLTAHQDISGKANTADLATVATSGSYNDLSNKPTIPSLNTNLFTVEQGTTSLNSTTGSLVDELNDLSQAGDNTFPTSTAVYNAIVAAINAAKVTIYSGTAAPSNSLGTNGDLYLQTS